MNLFMEVFEKRTNVTIFDKLDRFTTFFSNSYPPLKKFYQGELKDINPLVFEELERLQQDFEELRVGFQNNWSKLKSTGFYELIDLVEDCITSIETTQNLSRYLRSSITNELLGNTPTLEYTLKEGETLEKVSRSLLGSSNSEDDWSDISEKNSVQEEDYTLQGGLTIQLNFQQTQSLQITSVVDNLNGRSIYGKDLLRTLTFDDDDLVVLNNQETLLQSLNIIFNLHKGDNPEFFEDGIDPSLVVGTNQFTIQLLPLVRQILTTVSRDDSLRSVSITNLSREKDGLKIEYELTTRLGDIEKTFNII